MWLTQAVMQSPTAAALVTVSIDPAFDTDIQYTLTR